MGKTAMDRFLDAWIDDQEDKRKMARLPRGVHPDWRGCPGCGAIAVRRPGGVTTTEHSVSCPRVPGNDS